MTDLSDKLLFGENLGFENINRKDESNLTTIAELTVNKKKKEYSEVQDKLTQLGCYQAIADLYQCSNENGLPAKELIGRVHKNGNMQLIEELTQVDFLTLTNLMHLNELIPTNYCQQIKEQYERMKPTNDENAKYKKLSEQQPEKKETRKQLNSKVISFAKYTK